MRSFRIILLALLIFAGVGAFLWCGGSVAETSGKSAGSARSASETAAPGVSESPGESSGRKSDDTAEVVDEGGAHSGHDGRVSASQGARLKSASRLIDQDFVRGLANGPDEVFISLPDGRTLSARVTLRRYDTAGKPAGVSGLVLRPAAGTFYFHNQPPGGIEGPVTGSIAMTGDDTGYRVLSLTGGQSALTALPIDDVVCRMAAEPEDPQCRETAAEEIPADHPTGIPVPAYQNGIVPLQSLPGAKAVAYLDFDGEKGPFQGWGEFDAVAPGVTASQVREVWARVAEDFAPFNINVTTDLQVYLEAPETSRQRCIITPTNTAAPGAAGVAYVGSFNSAGEVPCWSFYSSGKSAAEAISHEIGHTLGLSHDGRISPAEDYYGGHGSGNVGWAPIMGVGYYENLSQWSKGEYASANQTQDDLAIITGDNNNVDFRNDDAGDTHATAATLEIFNSGTVDSEGVIEQRTDVDAFLFSTTGGTINLTIAPVAQGPNLDIEASVYDASGTRLAVSNPDTAVNATLNLTVPAGEYTVRVDGVGRGDPLGTGYTDYASIGQYTITGSIAGATGPARFAIAENSSAGTPVGTVVPALSHSGQLFWAITAGNSEGAFAIDSDTGLLSVGNAAVLDYEALSPGWTMPPVFNLTITITDSTNPELSETLRVVVNVTNVNEAPSVTAASFTVLSRTVAGTILGKVAASDPDEFDFPKFSIVGGDPDGKFTIDATGRLLSRGDWSSMASSYPLTVRVTDNGSPALTRDAVVTVQVLAVGPAYTPGLIYRSMYENISGGSISNLTSSASFPNNPTRQIRITDFTDNTRGELYGSAIRCWMIAPVTGVYRFWVSGDDANELQFTPSANPAAATRIAYRNSATGYQSWSESGTQQSVTYNLTAGQVCYLEARQKERTGGDHVAVAWEIRHQTTAAVIRAREVIPGRYLSVRVITAPKAPTDLRATVSGTTASLAWNSTAGSIDRSYRVQRASLNGGPYAEVASGLVSPEYQDAGLTSGQTYYYLVSAVNEVGVSSPANRLLINPPLSRKLSGTVIGSGTTVGSNTYAKAFDGQLGTYFEIASDAGWAGIDFGEGSRAVLTSLRYSPRNSNVSSQTNANYMIGGSFQVSSTPDFSADVVTLFTVPSAPAYNTLTSAAIPSLASTYRYGRYLTAAGKNANLSELEFYGVSPLPAPEGLTATPGEGSSSLSWNEVAGAISYTLKRSTVAGGPYQVVASNLIATSYQDSGLDPQGIYYYVVSAVNEAGEGALSAEAIHADSYGKWLIDSGLTPGGAGAAFDQDADANGVQNGTEYMVLSGLQLASDPEGLTLSAILRRDEKVITRLWLSADLSEWSEAVFSESADQSGVPEGYTRITAAVTTLANPPLRFYRLTFTR